MKRTNTKRLQVSNKDLKVRSLSKTMITFIVYFIYSFIFFEFLKTSGLSEILIAFLSDLFFIVFIFLMYKKEIKKDFENLSKKYKLKKLIKTIVIWFLILLISKFLVGIIAGVLMPNLTLDDNTNKIYRIASLSFFYITFKTMIFSVVAEELLFKEAMRTVVSNNILFIIVSSLLYTLMSFLYADLSVNYLGMYFLMYLFPSLILSYAYVKNNDNIFLIILIKFVYNLIPFAFLIGGILF